MFDHSGVWLVPYLYMDPAGGRWTAIPCTFRPTQCGRRQGGALLVPDGRAAVLFAVDERGLDRARLRDRLAAGDRLRHDAGDRAEARPRADSGGGGIEDVLRGVRWRCSATHSRSRSYAVAMVAATNAQSANQAVLVLSDKTIAK